MRVLAEVTLAPGEDRSTVQTREHALAMKITRPWRGDSKEWLTVHVHHREVSPTEFDLAGKTPYSQEGVRAWIVRSMPPESRSGRSIERTVTRSECELGSATGRIRKPQLSIESFGVPMHFPFSLVTLLCIW
jgi:hypothetical protein